MCWKCGKSVSLEIISRDSECPECHKALHSCKNCLFYEPGSYHDCHESAEELVADKEKANFCDTFRIKREWTSGAAGSASKKAEDAKKAFESLFA
ncbi:MAG: hypothetical protein II146_06905 [Treponema sp.]|nr:hypothetical protein [Treponema sp.]